MSFIFTLILKHFQTWFHYREIFSKINKSLRIPTYSLRKFMKNNKKLYLLEVLHLAKKIKNKIIIRLDWIISTNHLILKRLQNLYIEILPRFKHKKCRKITLKKKQIFKDIWKKQMDRYKLFKQKKLKSMECFNKLK